MSSIDEKRVYSATEGKTDVFVATGAGVARVECSGDHVGGFGLVHRCVARDIAAEGNRLAVATDEDVLVWNGDAFEGTGFGPATERRSAPQAVGQSPTTERSEAPQAAGCNPATAVGYHDSGLIVASAGTDQIAEYTEGEWRVLTTESDAIDVRAIDGDLFAAASGVYRRSNGMDGGQIEPVGLNDARDVSTAPIPLVATASGLYQLKNGWEIVLDGDVTLIESDGTRTHAASDDGLYARTENGDWERIELPVEEQIAGVGYGESVYAVTVDGTFLLNTADGWQTRSLGLPDVCGLAVPDPERKSV